MNQRLLALDVFRGAAVAGMVLVNNPGSWAHLYPPLAHAPWHGLTPTDLVFPFFLFAVGHALALVLPRFEAGPAADFWVKVARRTALIFAIGLFLNIAPLVRWTPEGELAWRSLETLRVMGVLQRIALCFAAAAVIAWWLRGARPWALPAVAGALLLGYWGLCLALGAPGDPYSLEGFFGTHWDRALLGAQHLYRGEGVPFDPEGLASTLPATAQVLLGVAAGQWLARRPGWRGERLLLLAALALAVLGMAWQTVFPLNKKIWSSSYVLVTTALALVLLVALLRALPGSRPASAAREPLWAGWLASFGRNPLFLFVLAGLLPRVLGLFRWPDGLAEDGTPRFLSPWPWAFRELFMPLGGAFSADPRLASLLMALTYLALYAALGLWLDRRRIYFRV